MKLIIILDEPYPDGMACSKRIHLYSKGLIKSGVDVRILIPKPKLIGNKNVVPSIGISEGVPYRYSNKSPYRSRSFLKRRITDAFGPLRTAMHCVRENPDSILFVGGLYQVLLFKIVSIITRSRYLCEKSEVPYMDKDSISLFNILYLKITFSLFDGIITITNELANYFKNYLKLNVETYTIPILIDEITSTKEVSTEKAKNYLLYTGSLIDRKDGILTLLKAFAKLISIYSDYQFIITGNAKSSSDFKIVKEVIDVLGINEKVYFTGFIDNQQLNDLMRNAKLLVLVKPENRQNRYNFPTKIGEYLSSGTPVLCTENTTINSYFTDWENMFICKNDVDDITKKMVGILNNYKEAQIVGKKGKEYAEKHFNYLTQMERLKNFI